MQSALSRSFLVVAALAVLRCGSGESIGFGGSDAGPDGSSGSSGSGSTGNGGSAGVGTGGVAGVGGSGNGGTGGSNTPTFSYLLWSNLASARIVRVSNSDGAVIDEKKLDYPEDGFVARDLDVMRDGTFRLLWTRDQGEARLWKLDTSFAKTEEIQYHASEPSAGWSTTRYAKLPDGSSRLTWFNPTVGTAVVWTLEADDAFVNGPKRSYTPAADIGSWVPTSYGASPDNTLRLLWNFEGSSVGVQQPSSVWHLDPAEAKATAKTVEYKIGWAARGYHVEDSGRVRMLWANDDEAKGLLCTYANDAAVVSVPDTANPGFGDGQCMTYGPEASWSLRAFTHQECAPGECSTPCVDGMKQGFLLTPPSSLSGTGLDVNSPTIQPFQPRFVLWSDGAEKQRYAYIPKCGKIDTTDMDHWQMPVGSRFWKEFRRNGVHVETRLIHRYGPGKDDWIFAAYQMASNGTGGTWVPNGVQNANGTSHDIPSASQCTQCHGKLPEHILGFGAIQLSHTLPGTTIASLSNTGKLTVPHAQSFEPPGDEEQKAALGYFHANCGNCHNDADISIDMRLRLLTTDASLEQTGVYQTAIGKPTTTFDCLGIGIGTCDRIDSTDSTLSAVLMRMQNKTVAVQMPPIGSEIVDPTGVAAVTAFIQGL
jgi:hypothetical protein